MTVAAVQQLQPVTNFNQLTPVEKHRLIQCNQEIRGTINEREDLDQQQKTDLINELAARTTQVAFNRHFFREAPNIALRGINLETAPPTTLCETFLKSGVFCAGGAAFLQEPVISGIVLGTLH